MIKIHTCVAGDNVGHEGTWARVVDHWAKVLGEPRFRSQHLPPFTQVPAPLSSFFPRVKEGVLTPSLPDSGSGTQMVQCLPELLKSQRALSVRFL